MIRIDLNKKLGNGLTIKELYELELIHYSPINYNLSKATVTINEEIRSIIYNLPEEDRLFVVLFDYFKTNISAMSRNVNISNITLSKNWKRIKTTIQEEYKKQML